jgi:hypothetical protein
VNHRTQKTIGSKMRESVIFDTRVSTLNSLDIYIYFYLLSTTILDVPTRFHAQLTGSPLSHWLDPNRSALFLYIRFFFCLYSPLSQSFLSDFSFHPCSRFFFLCVCGCGCLCVMLILLM